MKALKRFLLLALALIMSLSLFACANTGDPSNPSDPSDPSNPSNPSNPSGSDVENYYEIDYQVLTDNEFAIEFEGSEPTEVLFGGVSTKEEDLYQPDWDIVDGKIVVKVEGAMMSARDDKLLKFSTDTKSYKSYLTMNPISNNYFVVDGGEASFKLAIANIISAKFNDTDVASVAGITKDASGLTFTKELLATKLGVNKVEIKTANKNYLLSICAVTREELRQPITFEDGKMTPFITVFGNDYRVVTSSDVTDATIKAKYSGEYTYSYGSDTNTKIDNEYFLEIDHKAGSMEPLQVYVSSFYVQQRLLALSQIDKNDAPFTPVEWYEVCETGYNRFMLPSTTYFMTWRVFCTKADNLINGYYLNIGGQDIGGTEATYYGFYEKDLVNRQLFNKKAYNLIIDQDGDIVEPYFKVHFGDVLESHKVYLDDICACLTDTSMTNKNLPLPSKLA